MSTNSAILLDPRYLITDYEQKKKFIPKFGTREYLKDKLNFSFAVLFGSWYGFYKLLNTNPKNLTLQKFIPKTIMWKYLVSFFLASSLRNAILYI